jgi:hypothetical protein
VVSGIIWQKNFSEYEFFGLKRAIGNVGIVGMDITKNGSRFSILLSSVYIFKSNKI